MLRLNYGFSFSILEKMPSSILILIWLLSFALLCFYCIKNKNKLVNSGSILLFTGAVSNLIDRLRLGYIIDWIYWGVCVSFADIYLILGGFIYLLVWGKRKETM